MEYKPCEVADGPYLTTVCMSTEFEIHSCFSDLLDLLWRMIEEYRRLLRIKVFKRANHACNITFLSWFWMIDPDKVEFINREDLIIEYLGLCIFEDCERSFHSEVGFMISIDIEYPMRCFYIIQRIDEVFEPTIHTIEKIPRDTDNFWMFMVYLFYDLPKITSPQYMSDMNVRDLYDFFSFPRWWEIRDSDSDTSNTRMHRIIKTVDRYSATHSDTCNPKYVHRNVYSERFCEQSEYPYECE